MQQKKTAHIRLHTPRPHTIRKMNAIIIMESKIAESMNDRS